MIVTSGECVVVTDAYVREAVRMRNLCAKATTRVDISYGLIHSSDRCFSADSRFVSICYGHVVPVYRIAFRGTAFRFEFFRRFEHYCDVRSGAALNVH